MFPETVPQEGPNRGIYQCRDAEFWTSGFFPGSLYCVLERLRKYPDASLFGRPTASADISNGTSNPAGGDLRLSISRLGELCQKWSTPIYAMSSRKDTHDLGFIIQPSLRRDWELFGHQKSLDAVLAAAESLASRFDERVGAIRSWDLFYPRQGITSMEDDFLVIIDSLCSE